MGLPLSLSTHLATQAKGARQSEATWLWLGGHQRHIQGQGQEPGMRHAGLPVLGSLGLHQGLLEV